MVVVVASELGTGSSGDNEEDAGGSLNPGGKKLGETSAKRMPDKMLTGSFLTFSVLDGAGVVDVDVVINVAEDGCRAVG